MADNTKDIIVLGIGALGIWYLYEQGYLYQWFGSAFLPPGATPTVTPAVSTPIATSTTVPASTVNGSTPSTASVSLAGPVTATINGGIQANVSINGSVQNLSAIPSQGQIYNTSGQGINAQLQAQGVNVASLIAMMQAAYTPSSGSSATGTSSSSGNQYGGQPVGASSAPTVNPPPALTPQAAATTPSSSVSSAQITAAGPAIQLALLQGAIQQFSGTSVIAYMLGWGGQSAGQTESTNISIPGWPEGTVTYSFDGNNWNLQGVTATGGTSGIGNRVSLGLIHGGPRFRVSRGMLR